MEKKCKWYYIEDEFEWHTEWGYETAGPTDSLKGADWQFCPFCGAEIDERQDTPVDDEYDDILYERMKERRLEHWEP